MEESEDAVTSGTLRIPPILLIKTSLSPDLLHHSAGRRKATGLLRCRTGRQFLLCAATCGLPSAGCRFAGCTAHFAARERLRSELISALC
jgi:hypothetical protein